MKAIGAIKYRNNIFNAAANATTAGNKTAAHTPYIPDMFFIKGMVTHFKYINIGLMINSVIRFKLVCSFIMSIRVVHPALFMSKQRIYIIP